MKKLLNMILLGVALAVLPGCMSFQDGGIYVGKKPAYLTDSAFSAAYETVDAFLQWEHSNGDALYKLVPQVKQTADLIRREAPTWIRAYQEHRAAYMLFPTKENQTQMEDALAELEKFVSLAHSITLKYAN